MYQGIIQTKNTMMKKKNYDAPDLALLQLSNQLALCTSGQLESLNENDYPGGENWEETL